MITDTERELLRDIQRRPLDHEDIRRGRKSERRTQLRLQRLIECYEELLHGMKTNKSGIRV